MHHYNRGCFYLLCTIQEAVFIQIQPASQCAKAIGPTLGTMAFCTLGWYHPVINPTPSLSGERKYCWRLYVNYISYLQDDLNSIHRCAAVSYVVIKTVPPAAWYHQNDFVPQTCCCAKPNKHASHQFTIRTDYNNRRSKRFLYEWRMAMNTRSDQHIRLWVEGLSNPCVFVICE